jgi:sugar/nucleoside kinase (ribokinase family)
MQKTDLLVIGEINPDLILTGDVVPEFSQVEKIVDSASLNIGSSSVIFAVAAAKLGLKVRFFGLCGKDDFGDFMLKSMADQGIDISQIKPSAACTTGLSVHLDTGKDRAILTDLGCMALLRYEDIPQDLFGASRHLHVASYFLQAGLRPGLVKLFQHAHQKGMTTSLDTNWDPDQCWVGVKEILPFTDIFLPNENEALSLSGQKTVEEAARLLGDLAGIVSVKLGKQGGLAIRAGAMVKAPSLPVRVVDTVGAGDTFNAGFVFGFLQGWPLQKTLEFACACGSLSTRGKGIDAQPSLEEINKALGLK